MHPSPIQEDRAKRIRSHSRPIPIRVEHNSKGVGWNTLYAQAWPKIERECLEFNRRGNKYLRFVILIGKVNFDGFQNILPGHVTTTAIPLQIGIKL